MAGHPKGFLLQLDLDLFVSRSLEVKHKDFYKGKTGWSKGLISPSTNASFGRLRLTTGLFGDTVSEMAAPAWNGHQWAPGSSQEPTKSADGSKVKG